MISSISCPVCQNLCSSEAVSCPKCGHPFGEVGKERGPTNNTRTKTNVWKYLTIGLGSLVILGIGAFFLVKSIGDRSNDKSNQTIGSSNSIPSANQQLTAAATPEPVGTLEIEAGIDYKVGGVQPVTSEEFYLLDMDLEQILKMSGVKPMTKSYYQAYALGILYWSDKPEHVKATNAIKQHVKYSAKTDLKGKARFANVQTGSYYIFGFTKTRGGYSIWNTKTDINAGLNSQILDSKNAALAF